MEALPGELWDLILSFLNHTREVATAVLVCHDFHDLVLANPRLHNLLILPCFDELESKDVVLDEDAHHARPKDGQAKVWSYPSMLSNTAYVRPYNAHDRTAATVVHFHIPDFEPSTYFCVSVACTTEPSRNPKSQFAASYYSDGDVHSYGFYAPYEREDMPAARYSKGDIISVQIGVRDVNTDASPHAPGWSRYMRLMEQKNRFGLEESVEEKYEVHPYAIFFKNFTMVHQPMVLPWVDALKWPQALRIGVTFTQGNNEHVRIIAPASSGATTTSTFKPLLPTACGSPPTTRVDDAQANNTP